MKIFSKHSSDINYKLSQTGVSGRYSDHIFRDDDTGERIMFAKLDKGVSYAQMKVYGPTHFYVIKGELIINNQNYSEGTYIRINSEEEFTPKTILGCEVLCIYTKGYSR